MLRTHAIDLRKGNTPVRRFTLFHGASRSSDLGVYKDELAKLARDGWLNYVPTVSRPLDDPSWSGETGRVEDVIRKEAARLGLPALNAVTYLCGHPGMIANARNMLRSIHFPEERIREERFFVMPSDEKDTQTTSSQPKAS
jgi:ferredoxin--NADP+ reductase